MQRRGKATLYELMRRGSGEASPQRPAGGGFSLGSGAIEPQRPWKLWTAVGVIACAALAAGAWMYFFRGDASAPAAPGGVPAGPAGTGTVPKAPSVAPGAGEGRPGLGSAAVGDPRTAGLNYLVVSNTSAAGAAELASFLRGKGLDARVVSGNNAGLSKVIVLPGSQTGADQTAERLKDEAKAAGRLWKAVKAGNPDLSDCYYEKFKG